MNLKKYNRHSIRLKGYDYAQPGVYFITICTHNMVHRFGRIINGQMKLNHFGEIVLHQWNTLTDRYPNIKLDSFVVMPNHIHGVIQIVPVGASLADAPTGNADARSQISDVRYVLLDAQSNGLSQIGANQDRESIGKKRTPARGARTGISVGDIVGGYKSLCVHYCLQWINVNNPKFHMGKLWHRNYWEHIVRNEVDYNRIALYIKNNPLKWERDRSR